MRSKRPFPIPSGCVVLLCPAGKEEILAGDFMTKSQGTVQYPAAVRLLSSKQLPRCHGFPTHPPNISKGRNMPPQNAGCQKRTFKLIKEGGVVALPKPMF